MPESENFLETISLYRAYLFNVGFKEKTVNGYASYVRRLLIYMENLGILKVSDMQNKDIAGYFVSQRFSDRKPKGIQTEACGLKKFILFLEENGHIDCKWLHYAIPHHRVPTKESSQPSLLRWSQILWKMNLTA